MKKEVKKSESGRTMVEMLGTLAIIGVLSIGGVTGYGRAITTYRTNSAVETAQRQAAIIAGDVGLGQAVSPGSATKLKAPAGYEVAVKDAAGSETNVTATTPYFGVEVGGEGGTALPKEVAKEILERAIGEWKNVHAFGVKDSGGTIHWLNSTGSGEYGFEGVVGDAQTVIIIVVYASDLSLRSTDDLNVNGYDVTPEEDPNVCDPECNVCSTCEEGQCVADSNKDTDPCTTDLGEEGTCSAGECVPTSADNCPEGTTVAEDYTGSNALADGKCICTSYTTNQCGQGYFCDIKGSDMPKCDSPIIGSCVQIKDSDYRDASINGLGQVRKSTNKMSWYSAMSWCNAQGKNLLDVSKFGCYQTGKNSLVYEHSGYSGGCCAKGQTCSANSNWYTDANKSAYSSVIRALNDEFGHDGYAASWYWTSSAWSWTAVCAKSQVRLTNGTQPGGSGPNSDGVALCQ